MRTWIARVSDSSYISNKFSVPHCITLLPVSCLCAMILDTGFFQLTNCLWYGISAFFFLFLVCSTVLAFTHFPVIIPGSLTQHLSVPDWINCVQLQLPLLVPLPGVYMFLGSSQGVPSPQAKFWWNTETE